MKKPLLSHPAPAADLREARRRALKSGSWAALLTAAVLAVVILLNLVVAALPAQYTRFDISTGRLFTLTETTKNLLGSMESDVTAYYLGISGQEDENVTQLLDRYAGAGAHFRWEQKDPNLYPNFARQVGAADANVDSVILICGDKTELVDSYSMYEADYSSYYTTGSYTYSFAAESAITTALAAVLRTEQTALYSMTGHGEAALDADFTQTLENAGFAVQEFSLVTAGAIPGDAAMLLLNAPQVDYTADDVAALRDYLQNGGRLLVVTDLTVPTPNLDALLAEYGLTRQPGVLIERDMDHYLYGYPQTYLLPDIGQNEATAGMAQGLYALAPVAQGILYDDTMDYEFLPLLSVTDAGYSKVDYQNADLLTKTDADPAGPFALAVAVQGGEAGAKLAWLNCANLLDAGADQVVYGGNAQWLGSVANWLCDQENAAVIDAKSMSAAILNVPAGMAVGLGLLFVLVLPLGAVIGGAVYCLLRRRR